MKRKLLVGAAMMMGGAAFAADGMKLGGFVDAGYRWGKNPAMNTFGIMDGAVYVGKTMGMGEVMVDIPFSYRPNMAPVVTGTGTGNAYLASVDNSLIAGFDKGQAWISWKYENGFMWKLGQFDKLYGMEANDTADIYFADHGMVYNMFKKTHTGLQLGYDFSDALGLSLLLADNGGAGKMTNGNPDMGFKLMSKSDAFWASVGGLFTRQPGTAMNQTYDLQVGSKMDMTNVGVEFVFNKMGDNSGFGVLGSFVMGVNDMVDVGIRPEYVKDATAAANKTFQVSVGPGMHMNKDMTLRLDYTFSKVSVASGTAPDPTHVVALSAVHRF